MSLQFARNAKVPETGKRVQSLSYDLKDGRGWRVMKRSCSLGYHFLSDERHGVAHMLCFMTILLIFLSFLHWIWKTDWRSFSYSTKEILPLKYMFQANKNDNGSDITLVFGMLSNILPVKLVNVIMQNLTDTILTSTVRV